MNDAGGAYAKRAISYAKFLSLEVAPPIILIGFGRVNSKIILACIAVTRNDDDFGMLAKSEYWPISMSDPNQRVWTDDYSNVLGALLRRLRERASGN